MSKEAISEVTPAPINKTITTTPKGLITALCTFLIWGNFPFYFKLLGEYQAGEIIVHRIFWTFVLLVLMLLIGKRTKWLRVIKDNPKWLILTFVAALLIGTNWLIYVWAVNNDKILEASLGYFLSPLLGVALSVILLKERLRLLQKIAIGLAALAVLVQIVWLGGLPWISLIIGASFVFYGIIQRQTPFDAVDGLFIETALLVPICLFWVSQVNVASSHLSFWVSSDIWLLTLAGPVTLIPLLLYNKSTKMVSFNILSFMNYITPSMIFLIAVFYYKEAFDIRRMAVFSLIWAGLFLFSMDMLKNRKRLS